MNKLGQARDHVAPVIELFPKKVGNHDGKPENKPLVKLEYTPREPSRADLMHPAYSDMIGGIHALTDAQGRVIGQAAITHRAIMQIEQEARNGDDQRYPYEPRQVYSIPKDIGENEEDAELITLARAGNER